MRTAVEVLVYAAAGMAGSWLAAVQWRRARGLARCPLCRGTGHVADGTKLKRVGHAACGQQPDGLAGTSALLGAVSELRVALQSEAACTCRPHGLGQGKVYRCLRCLTLDATAQLGGAA